MEQKTILFLFGTAILVGVLHFFLFSPPAGFPVGKNIAIPQGASLKKTSSILKENRIIRSRPVFEFFIIIQGAEKHIKPAYYVFEKELPVFSVAWRIAGGKFPMAPIVVTIPEGYTTEEMKELFSAKLPNFNTEAFMSQAKPKEGYLFPDTYFFINTDSEKQALELLSENFDKKIGPLMEDINASGHTLSEIITMASIIEGEAKGEDDRAVISGILWKRLSINMPLQADAAPVTYEEQGLPQEPIGNPGLAAIRAAIHPVASPYLYYLHDKDGQIHYAKNFSEHRANIEKYLK
jgi:UPF0755 protein